MAPEFSFRDSATLRRRLEVSSLLALRAVAQSAKLVQQPPRTARLGANRQQCLEADLICNGRNCNSRTATAGTATAELQQPNYNSRESGGELLAPGARQGRKNSCLSLLALPITRTETKAAKAPIGVVAMSFQFSFNTSGCLSTSRDSGCRVMANPSLNRTHCGVPPFGLKKPSPNANPPQWAG